MTPADLERYAEALFGFGFPWQSAIARALGVTSRTVRRWKAGQNAIHDSILGILIDLADERRDELSELIIELEDLRDSQ
jgi:hypothetical protein